MARSRRDRHPCRPERAVRSIHRADESGGSNGSETYPKVQSFGPCRRAWLAMCIRIVHRKYGQPCRPFDKCRCDPDVDAPLLAWVVKADRHRTGRSWRPRKVFFPLMLLALELRDSLQLGACGQGVPELQTDRADRTAKIPILLFDVIPCGPRKGFRGSTTWVS